MNILVIQTTHSGIYYHRQFVPHFYWHDSGDDFKHDLTVTVETAHFDKLTHVTNNIHFDIVLFSIAITDPPQLPHFIDFLKHRGSKIVLDIDDRYMKRADVSKSIRRADAIICVSKPLASHYFSYGAKKFPYVIENGIYNGGVPEETKFEPALWPQYRQFENFGVDNDDVVFGYLGSTRHEEDLKMMKYDFSSRKLFIVCEEYFKILDANAYSTLKHWNEYAWEYNAIDVALAPLVDNKFNISKSQLKIFEAGFKKKAIICTDVEPYNRDKEYWKNVVDFMPHGESWKDRIESYTPEEARQKGEQLYKLVQPYEIRELNKKRREIYKEIIGNGHYGPVSTPKPETANNPNLKRRNNNIRPKKRKR